MIKLTVRVVRLFVHWLYTKTIPATSWYVVWSPIIDRSLKPGMYDAWVQEVFIVLIKAYVFGDKFLATGFRQDVHRKFSNLLSGYCLTLPGGCQVIEYAFNNVPSDRVMLQHLVDDYCSQWDETQLDHVSVRIPKWLPRAFPVRVERRFAELRSMINNVGNRSRCYYEHTSAEERKKCRYLHMFYHEVEEYGYFYDDYWRR